jgi:hypothetical protein
MSGKPFRTKSAYKNHPFILRVIFWMAFATSVPGISFSQMRNTADTLVTRDFGAKTDSIPAPAFWKPQTIAVPGAMIVYGLIALKNKELIRFNHRIREDIHPVTPGVARPLDDYLQFAPAIAAFSLPLIGVHGQHNFVDQVMIFGLSNVIMGLTVYPAKRIFNSMRPDSSDRFSFPSGHTTEAFANAEFLRLEYRGQSPWYGIAGYAAAATTGYLRMYHDKHWLNDVLAGAGIGILSTRLSWYYYPRLAKLITGKPTLKFAVFPTWHQGSAGLAIFRRF